MEWRVIPGHGLLDNWRFELMINFMQVSSINRFGKGLVLYTFDLWLFEVSNFILVYVTVISSSVSCPFSSCTGQTFSQNGSCIIACVLHSTAPYVTCVTPMQS